MTPRPPVSVVLPFHGSRAAAEATLAALRRLELRDGDELVVVDNTGRDAVPDGRGARVVRAAQEPSAYYARNAGAATVEHEWLVFLDADCVPAPDLLDRYFEPAPEEGCGALVGEVAGLDGQPGLVPAYARSRGHLAQRVHVEDPFRPWGVTANLLVRRAAWEDVGGFQEGVRSGGDCEFSWRLQDAGWTIGYRPAAAVEHEHRPDVRALVRQAGRYGAGRRWLRSRYPRAVSRPAVVREGARAVVGLVVWTAAGQRQRGVFKALDGLYTAGFGAAWALSNTPPGRGDRLPAAKVAAVCGRFPARGDAAPATALQALGSGVVVDAQARPVRVDRALARRLPIAYAEDDGPLRRVAATGWLAVRRPAAVAAAARAGAPVPALAPRARRLLRAGVTQVVAAEPELEPTAAHLRRLTGAA